MKRHFFLVGMLCLIAFTQCRKHDDPIPKKNTLIIQFADGTTHSQRFDDLNVYGSHDPSWAAGASAQSGSDYSFSLQYDAGGGITTFDSTIIQYSQLIFISNGTNRWRVLSGTVNSDYTSGMFGNPTVKITFSNVVFRDTSITGPMRTIIASGNLVHKEHSPF